MDSKRMSEWWLTCSDYLVWASSFSAGRYHRATDVYQVFQLLLVWERTPIEFEDRTIRCVLCRSDFVFTAVEEIFFHSRQFKNDQKHY